MNEVLDGVRAVAGQIGLVDLTAGLLLVGGLVSGLRRRSLLTAVGSLASTALVLWLAGGAALVWGGPALQEAVQQSTLMQLVPPSTMVWEQLGQVVGELAPSERTGRL